MKKIIAVAAALMISACCVFAEQVEMTKTNMMDFSGNYSLYGGVAIDGSKASYMYNLAGGSFTLNSFTNDDFYGFFFNFDFYKGLTGSNVESGVKSAFNMNGFGGSGSYGVSFRQSLNEQLLFVEGIGFSMTMNTYRSSDLSTSAMEVFRGYVGLSGFAKAVYYLNDTFYVTGAVNASAYMFDITSLGIEHINVALSSNLWYDVKPSVGLGFKFNVKGMVESK